MEGIGVTGFFRVGLYGPKGEVQGLTDYIPNVITAVGFRDFIVANVGSSVGGATSAKVQAMAFGGTTMTGAGAPTSAMTALSSELTRVTAAQTFSGNGTLEATAVWATGSANTGDVGSVALFGTSSATTGSACAIASFASSQKASDQTLSITYQLRFASA